MGRRSTGSDRIDSLALRRTAAVALLALTFTGCARSPRAMSHMWDRVPSLRWSNSVDETQTIPQEPKVTANVAVVEPTEDADSISKGTPAIEVEWTPAPPDRADVAERELIDQFIADNPVSAEAPIDQRMQELKSALTADAERDLPEIVPSPESHPLRLRVEGLLRKSRELLAAGQFADARRTALQAVDLSGEAALEFLPNEDRPTDLLREIDDHRSAAGAPPREAVEEELANVGAPVPFALPVDAATEPNSAALTLPEIATSFSAGSVAANQPFSALSPQGVRANHAARTKTAFPPASPADANAPAEAYVRLGVPEAPLSIPRGPNWTPPALDEGLPPSPTVAPSPPIVDEIAPLPRFRADDSTARPKSALAASTNRRAWHWMDWMPMGALALVLTVCGVALGLRRWRHGG